MERRCSNCASGYVQRNGQIPGDTGTLFCLGARHVPPPHWRHGREYQKGDPPMLHLVLDETQAEGCAAFVPNVSAQDTSHE
jgi:hypothetical protein